MKKIIIISSEFLGKGDNELGSKLMGSFLRKITIEKSKPEKMFFINSGVKLLANDSPVYDAIELLESQGITLTACGTCVRHYKLNDIIADEVIGDMIGLVSNMMNSDDVITIG